MSIFNPNIIQYESDIERYQRQKRLWNKIIDAAHEIDKRGKNASAYYIVCNEETAEAFVRQYPTS